VEEAAAAAMSLVTQAEKLQDTVNQYQLLDTDTISRAPQQRVSLGRTGTDNY